MADLVQGFNFRISLGRSTSPGPSAAPPPALTGAPSRAARTGAGARADGPDRLGDGGFQECSGLELEMEVGDHPEGGRNDGLARGIGRVKLQPIVLRRGMLVPTPGGRADSALWDWLYGIVGGENRSVRYDGDIEVLDPTGARTLAHWRFVRGLPVKVAGPALNARTGEIAMEELHIAHEGLRLEGT
ncbi:phage tail protein [Streptomyces sp. NRRL WC-3742]|uniref:phage tail protein n=1 Tax=Streptomyces sp. NRRL WC-3742 TaxID=1463934 RepID=UPI0004C63180|nr:phage tail protein [Streptomyces sp. NRRL WC-3742]